jgi:hypothetical protein
MFHLTAEQMEAEPTDEFFTNLFIHNEIEERKRRKQEQDK